MPEQHPLPPPAYSDGSGPSSDAAQVGSTRPLPAHLSEPYRERRYVVFAYWTDAGWWRREGNYATLEQAQRVADAHNGQGRAVIVAQQDVTYGPHLPVTGASGASPVTASQADRQPHADVTDPAAPLRVNDTVSEGAWCECPGTTRRHFRTPACPVSADRHPDDPAPTEAPDA